MADTAMEQTRGNRRLVLDGPVGFIRNKEGEITGIDVMVRLFEDGEEVKIDPHRIFINPPTQVVDGEGEDRSFRFAPEDAFWDVLWDSVTSTPAPEGWGTLGTVTTIFSSLADGHVLSTDATYASARDGAGTVSSDDSSTSFRVGQNHDTVYSLYQGFVSFDTSVIPETDVIFDASLDLYAVELNTSSANFVIEVRKFDWLPTLSADDWTPGDDLETLPYRSEAFTWLFDVGGVNRYYRFKRYSGFLEDVEARGQVSLMLSSIWTRAGLPPAPGRSEYVVFASSNAAGTTQDPKLVVVHGHKGVRFVDSAQVLSSAVGVEPVGVQEGDVLIAVTTNDGAPLTAPSGWSQIGLTRVGGEFDTAGQVWMIRRGADPPDLTWTGTLDFPSVYIAAYRYVESIVAVATSAAGSAEAPSLNATDTEQTLVCVCADADWFGFDVPFGMNDRSRLAGEFGSIATLFADLRIVAPGATGSKFFSTPAPVGAWSILLDPINLNTPPTADAGPDQTALEGDLVQLDGTGSHDAEVGLLLTGDAGDYASTPNHASLDITGDIWLAAEATPDGGWAPGVDMALVGKYSTGDSQRSYLLSVRDDGTLRLNWSEDGASPRAANSSIPIPTDDAGATGRMAVAAHLDVDFGGGTRVTFYTAPTLAGPWTAFGAPFDAEGTTSIFVGSAELAVGAFSGGVQENFAGVVHAAEVRSGGADGTVVANPDFSAQVGGTASFADSAGRTWTVHGDALIVGLSYEWTIVDSGGTGLVDADITNRLTASPSFTAPTVTDTRNIVIQLKVTDSGNLTDTDTVTVTVLNAVKVRVGGAWVNAIPHVRQGGAWVDAAVNARVGGAWDPVTEIP